MRRRSLRQIGTRQFLSTVVNFDLFALPDPNDGAHSQARLVQGNSGLLDRMVRLGWDERWHPAASFASKDKPTDPPCRLFYRLRSTRGEKDARSSLWATGRCLPSNFRSGMEARVYARPSVLFEPSFSISYLANRVQPSHPNSKHPPASLAGARPCSQSLSHRREWRR